MVHCVVSIPEPASVQPQFTTTSELCQPLPAGTWVGVATGGVVSAV